MKTAFALVFALASALTSLASPIAAPEAEPALEARQGCSIPAPNANVIDRIYRYARNRGVNSKVMLSMFETAWVESHYNNLSCGDQDSVGVFQQRTSQGWGSYSQIMNVEYSTGKYLDLAISINKQRPGLSAGDLAQAVQRSEYPLRYTQSESIARKYLNEAIGRNGNYSGGGSTNVGTSPGSGSGSSGSGSSGSSGSSSGCARTVTVKSGNTCSSVAKSAGISLSTLYSLNGSINSACTNLQVGQKVCVQKGSGSTSSAKPTTGNSSGGKASVPGNIASGTTKSCSKYHTVVSGNTCSALASKGGISLSSLYTLNTGINKSSCNNLQVGKAYCISA